MQLWDRSKLLALMVWQPEPEPHGDATHRADLVGCVRKLAEAATAERFPLVVAL